jgi:hypothetical protein
MDVHTQVIICIRKAVQFCVGRRKVRPTRKIGNQKVDTVRTRAETTLDSSVGAILLSNMDAAEPEPTVEGDAAPEAAPPPKDEFQWILDQTPRPREDEGAIQGGDVNVDIGIVNFDGINDTNDTNSVSISGDVVDEGGGDVDYDALIQATPLPNVPVFEGVAGASLEPGAQDDAHGLDGHRKNEGP